jgi:outer membrane protein TolC
MSPLIFVVEKAPWGMTETVLSSITGHSMNQPVDHILMAHNLALRIKTGGILPIFPMMGSPIHFCVKIAMAKSKWFRTRLLLLGSILAGTTAVVHGANGAISAMAADETIPLIEAPEAEPASGTGLPDAGSVEPLVEPLDNNPAPFSPQGFSAARVINLTLPDLLNLTLQGNRDLRNATLQRIVQRQELNATEQAFDPRFTPNLRVEVTQNLSASGTDIIETEEGLQFFTDATDIEEQALLNTTLNTRQGTDIIVGVDPLDATQPFLFRVAQPLLRGSDQTVNEAPVNEARLQENRNQLALQDTTITTVTTAITQYTTLINAQSQVTIQTQALGRRQQELKIQQTLVSAGRRARLDLFETERSVADAERDLADAQNQLQQANNAILNLIGTDQNLLFIASEETVEQLFNNAVARAATYDREALIALALERRPDYRQAQLLRRELELARLVAEDNLRWQLDAVASGNLGDFSQTRVGLQATRTFGQPDLETARVRSEVALEQQDNTLAQLEETIRNDVTAALGDVQANLLRVQAADRATTSARRQLEVAQTQFRLGRGNVTQFQLLDQEEQLVRAQTQETVARIAFLNGIAQLEQTVGITIDSWADQVDFTSVMEID